MPLPSQPCLMMLKLLSNLLPVDGAVVLQLRNHKPEFYEGNPALTRLHPLATPEITRKHGRPVEAELTTAAASNARQQAPKL